MDDQQTNVSAINLEIYKEFKEKVDNTLKIYNFTRLTYSVAITSFIARDKQKSSRKIQSATRNSSYVPNEFLSKEVKVIAEWLTNEQYRSRTGLTEAEFIDIIANKTTTLNKDGEMLFLWHTNDFNSESESPPELGMKKYIVSFEGEVTQSISFTVDTDDIDSARHRSHYLLSLMESEVDLPALFASSHKNLDETTFLTIWTHFEVFLKSYLENIIMIHPDRILLDRRFKEFKMSMKELLSATENLKSMEKLIIYLRDTIVSLSEKNLQPISYIINVINNAIHFDASPYDATYIINGERKIVGQDKLDEIREIRNTLIHSERKNESNSEDKTQSYKLDDGSFGEIVLVLRCVAVSLSNSFVKGKYRFKT